MLRTLTFLLMVTVSFAESITDLMHMTRCVPAVREYVQGESETMSWLTDKAGGDMDVVILFLVRTCSYNHKPSISRYDMISIERTMRSHVPPFTQDQLNELSEVLKEEFRSGWILGSDDISSPGMSPSMVVVALTVVILAISVRRIPKVSKTE